MHPLLTLALLRPAVAWDPNRCSLTSKHHAARPPPRQALLRRENREMPWRSDDMAWTGAWRAEAIDESLARRAMSTSERVCLEASRVAAELEWRAGISQEVQDCAADYLCFVSDLRDAEIAVTDAAMAAAISRRFAPPALMLHVTRKLLHREKALAPLTIEHRS